MDSTKSSHSWLGKKFKGKTMSQLVFYWLFITAAFIIAYLVTYSLIDRQFAVTANSGSVTASVLGVSNFNTTANNSVVNGSNIDFTTSITTNTTGILSGSLTFALTGDGTIATLPEGEGICLRISAKNVICEGILMTAQETESWVTTVAASTTCSSGSGELTMSVTLVADLQTFNSVKTVICNSGSQSSSSSQTITATASTTTSSGSNTSNGNNNGGNGSGNQSSSSTSASSDNVFSDEDLSGILLDADGDRNADGVIRDNALLVDSDDDGKLDTSYQPVAGMFDISVLMPKYAATFQGWLFAILFILYLVVITPLTMKIVQKMDSPKGD